MPVWRWSFHGEAFVSGIPENEVWSNPKPVEASTVVPLALSRGEAQ
jgi:hypothetical protein